MTDSTGTGSPWSWTVVVPLKGGPRAKSRLGGPPALATAIALDCLDAVLSARRAAPVLVVTPDPALASAARALGAGVRAESVPGAGLAAAIEDGLSAVRGPAAVLLGDLPALRPEDLDTALTLAEATLRDTPWVATPRAAFNATAPGVPGRGTPPNASDDSTLPGDATPPVTSVFVPDAEGTGTVLLAGISAAALFPAFGPRSAAAHLAAGARPLPADLPTLRRDVDTPADLAVAVRLGVGPRTRAVLPLGRFEPAFYPENG